MAFGVICPRGPHTCEDSCGGHFTSIPQSDLVHICCLFTVTCSPDAGCHCPFTKPLRVGPIPSCSMGAHLQASAPGTPQFNQRVVRSHQTPGPLQKPTNQCPLHRDDGSTAASSSVREKQACNPEVGSCLGNTWASNRIHF